MILCTLGVLLIVGLLIWQPDKGDEPRGLDEKSVEQIEKLDAYKYVSILAEYVHKGMSGDYGLVHKLVRIGKEVSK